jgi:Skp family chaperone for outer membrane proteins
MTFRTCLSALTLVLAAGTAAQAAPHGQSEFVRDYDTSKDGVVTLDEYNAIRKARLKSMDANADGKIDEAEYVAEYSARLETELAASTDTDEDKKVTRRRQIDQAHVRFGVLDKDKDKDLTVAEFHASGARAFAEHDGDGDGVVKAGEPKKSNDE